jgi:hypothetical protein
MHQWMRSHGVGAAVASPGAGSTIDPTIPRVDLFGQLCDVAEAAGGTVTAALPPLPPANFSAAPLFCFPPPSSSDVPPPCIVVTHPQDGFAFTQWLKDGPLEWRSACIGEFGFVSHLCDVFFVAGTCGCPRASSTPCCT